MLKQLPQKTSWTIALIVLFFGISVYFWFIHNPLAGTTVFHCRDFRTQEEAQKLFIRDSKKYKYLDANGDGLACNGLPQ